MARGRPPRSRRRRGAPLGLQGTLGTLLRTTLDQVGTLRDAAIEQARSSRDRLEALRLDRQRRDALADLGEAVLDLWYEGRLPGLAEHPEIAELIGEIEPLDDGSRPEASRRGAPREGPREPGRIRPRAGDRPDDDEYEAVSSAGWRPPRPAKDLRVWRPPPDYSDDAHADTGGTAPARREPVPGEVPAPAARRRAARRDRGGGIAFVSDEVADDDDDLTAYMHDDDVPGDAEPSGT